MIEKGAAPQAPASRTRLLRAAGRRFRGRFEPEADGNALQTHSHPDHLPTTQSHLRAHVRKSSRTVPQARGVQTERRFSCRNRASLKKQARRVVGPKVCLSAF